MVPVFSFLVAGPLIGRFGSARVIAAGCTIFAVGVAWWALSMGLRPDYAGQMLGGMLLTGIGVGLTLPTFMATGAAALPPHSFATGSAALNMLRQIGLAIGIAVLIAVLGSPRSPAGVLTNYQRASWIIAAVALAAGLVAIVLLSSRPAAAAGVAGAAATAPGPGAPATAPAVGARP
jgi:MFS family permease